jgi:hypothetical protein
MVNDMKCAAIALTLLALACTTNDATTTTTAAESTPPPSVAAEGPDVRLALLPPSRIGTAAAAPGTLEVEGRCLYLRAMDGTRTLPLFATFNTRWNRAAGVLEVENHTFRPGDAVTLGGGPLETVPANMQWVQAPDPGCRRDRMFVVYTISRDAR